MKTHKEAISARLRTLAAIVAAVTIILIHRAPAQLSSNAGSTNPCNLRCELETKAWRVLQEQLRSPYTAKKPSWDSSEWHTKSSVDGLTHLVSGQEPGLVNVGKPGSADSADPDTLVNLSGGLRVPLQDLIVEEASSRKKPGEEAKDKEEPTHLASVLFNNAAYDSVKSAVDSWNKGDMKVNIVRGSIIAKAIWKEVPMNGTVAEKVVNLYVYRPHDRVAGNSLKLRFDPSDFELVNLDLNMPVNDNACGPGQPIIPTSLRPLPSRRHISPHCFHAYELASNSKLIDKAKGEIDLPKVLPLFNQCDNGHPCYFVLEGIHFMVRLDAKDAIKNVVLRQTQEFEELLELGRSFNVDMPEVEQLDKLVEQSCGK